MATVLPDVATTLICRHFTTLPQRCGWMLPQHCVKIVPMLYQHWLRLYQRCGNVVWTLWQHRSPTLVTDVETTFRQCYVNVVATSLPSVGERCWDKIQATLCECCGNVALQHWELLLRQCSGNIVYQCWSPTLNQCWSPTLYQCCSLTLYQHCCPILYLVIWGPEWQSHKHLNFRHICNTSKHLYIGTFKSTTVSEQYYLPQHKHFHSKFTQLCLNASCPAKKHIRSTCFKCKIFIFKITKSSFLNNYAKIIVSFSPNTQPNAETTFRQHYMNVVTMLLPNVGEWDNVQTMFFPTIYQSFGWHLTNILLTIH